MPVVRRVSAASAFICALLTLAACHKPTPSIATVNGHPIPKTEWAAYLKFKRIKADDPHTQKAALDAYLSRTAVADVIESQKLLDNDAIGAEFSEFKKEMLISRYFEKYLDDKVTDQAIASYYDAHAADYQERKVHVAHLLFRTRAKMSDEERKVKLTAAQEACSKVKSGKDFAEVAAAVSEDQVSAKNGGDLGWLREGSIDPTFSKKAFELKVGDVSEPFETPFGFHVLKVLEAPQVVKKSLQMVQGDIRYMLRAEAKKAEMDRLQALTKIEVDGKALAAVGSSTAPDGKLADRK